MSELGKILIADDEPSFLATTSRLLREMGYECDCAADATEATELLQQGHYDLLISDIEMPGNSELKFIREVSRMAGGPPVILVTGYPSIDTAVGSFDLNVVAYLLKPMDTDKLLDKVKSSIESCRVYQALSTMHDRAQSWQRTLHQMKTSMRPSPAGTPQGAAWGILDMTFDNLLSELVDIRDLTEAMCTDLDSETAARLLKCTQPAALIDGLREAIEAIERTKGKFKSQELFAARRKLEKIVDTLDRTPVGRPTARARCRIEDKAPGKGTDSIAVTDETSAKGGRCLKVVDAPGLSKPWIPYVSYAPGYDAGVATVEFCLRLEPGAVMEYCWRGRHPKREFCAGPAVTFKDGEMSLGNGTKLPIPPGKWLKLKTTARLGEFDPGIGRAGAKEYGLWNLEVTLPDGTVRSFNGLKHADGEFKDLASVMFISTATKRAVFYLDEVRISSD